ncbi:SAM-dependent methyltransferase [Kibdelosporangium banguiense]|uniref:SAM-dependent methyltransferase n=1 Tax=Kibdelosporangium banguiense TaxID=1365924 RepID=A0ABS4TRJ3_9PSEU|nr:class I SAM-dependent methyltransferase [Kibdelosporangium banguiense]MBP2327021.1 SAM-dependent methyltransferase [Kibdelosporangium banguiense]
MIDLVSRPLELLPRSALMPTSEVDHPDWNYRPLLGLVQRLRFRIILKLLADNHFGSMLEIGYGSGVFMPELAKRCDNLYGIDPHPKHREVAESLARNGIDAELTQATVESLPYESDFFDCVVTVSTLEYVPRIDDACQELRRVLKPTGILAVVTPGATPIWDMALRLTTGESPTQYSDRRQNLQPALRREFTVTREVRVPAFGTTKLRLYTGLSLQPR